MRIFPANPSASINLHHIFFHPTQEFWKPLKNYARRVANQTNTFPLTLLVERSNSHPPTFHDALGMYACTRLRRRPIKAPCGEKRIEKTADIEYLIVVLIKHIILLSYVLR